MPQWLISLVVGVSLSGCATTPTPDPWANVEVDQTEAQQPVRLPEWPQETSETEDEVTFDLSGARALADYRIIGEGNTELAEEHAAQIDDLKDAVLSLVEGGRAQRRIADLRLEILEEERRHHFIEKMGLYALALFALGAASL